MNDSNQSEKNNSINVNNEEENEKYDPKHYAPIQEYTGEGYTLEGAREETGEIANEHREEVDKAVEEFFKNEYKTEIKVHNIVSAKDGVSVFVESIGEPHFYSFAIVPVDIKNKEVKTDQVWSQEGQVEAAIQGGLYAMAFEEEFQKLDDYLKGIAEEYPVIGRNYEGIGNVRGDGVSTAFYRVTPSGDVFKSLYEEFMKNTEMTKEDLRNFFKQNTFEPKYLSIVIEFFMSEVDMEPDKDIFEQVIADIDEMNNLPRGEYMIVLNDNYVDKKTARGTKDNSLQLIFPNEILKE